MLATKDLNYKNEAGDLKQKKIKVEHITPEDINNEKVITMRAFGFLCACIDMHDDNLMKDEDDTFYAIDFDRSLIDLSQSQITPTVCIGNESFNTMELVLDLNDGSLVTEAFAKVLETYASKRDELRAVLEKSAKYLQVPREETQKMLQALDHNCQIIKDMGLDKDFPTNIKSFIQKFEKAVPQTKIKYEARKLLILNSKQSFVAQIKQQDSNKQYKQKHCSIF